MKDENLDYFYPMFVGMQTSIIDTDLSLCHIGTIESRSPRSFLFELKISDALLLLTVLILYLPRCIILPTFAALQFLAIPLARLNNLCVNCIFSECDHFKLSFCRSTRNITFVVFFFEMYHSIVNFTFTLVNSNS